MSEKECPLWIVYLFANIPLHENDAGVQKRIRIFSSDRKNQNKLDIHDNESKYDSSMYFKIAWYFMIKHI